MALPYSLLGVLPPSSAVTEWIIERVSPVVRELVERHGGDVATMMKTKLVRLGNLIVWDGEDGQQVVAAIENLGESQQRIESAITGIGITQAAIEGTLNIVQSVSMATLGITSLSAALMAFRLASLNKRLATLSTTIKDVEATLNAQQKALLSSSIENLRRYENYEKRQRDPTSRASALDEAYRLALQSAHTYADLVDDECAKKSPRLPVLNYRCRQYVLALLLELQCASIREDDQLAEGRVHQESDRLHRLVDVTFRQTIASDPEQYLHPSLQADVTLDRLTDLYQQLQQARVLQGADIRDACDLFEHLRARIYRKPWLPSMPTFSNRRRPLLEKLRYLTAAVEDANRVAALRLLIADARRQGISLAGLRQQIANWIQKSIDGNDPALRTGFLAYRFV